MGHATHLSAGQFPAARRYLDVGRSFIIVVGWSGNQQRVLAARRVPAPPRRRAVRPGSAATRSKFKPLRRSESEPDIERHTVDALTELITDTDRPGPPRRAPVHGSRDVGRTLYTGVRLLRRKERKSAGPRPADR